MRAQWEGAQLGLRAFLDPRVLRVLQYSGVRTSFESRSDAYRGRCAFFENDCLWKGAGWETTGTLRPGVQAL